MVVIQEMVKVGSDLIRIIKTKDFEKSLFLMERKRYEYQTARTPQGF